MMTYEEFIGFYQKYGRTPNQIQPPNQPLNEKQLKSAYNKYVKGEEKKIKRQERQIEKQKNKEVQIEQNEKLQEVYKSVDKRDRYKCKLISKLSDNEYKELLQHSGGFLVNAIDHAHVLSRGMYPELKYDSNNIVLLNRYSHSMLDQNRCPITGKNITGKEKDKWWRFIIGEEKYSQLLSEIQGGGE